MLTTHAQVLLARWTYTVRMQSAYRERLLNNPTNVKSVASARNEWPAHASLSMR